MAAEDSRCTTLTVRGFCAVLDTTMPRQKGKRAQQSQNPGRQATHERGRSHLREAWAGGNYRQHSASPNGSSDVDSEFAIPFRLAMWDLGQCDKKRCTGTKLVRQQVVSELRLGVPFPGVILSPNGKCCVSNEDKELIGAKGLAVVDCSWNKLDEVPFGMLLLRSKAAFTCPVKAIMDLIVPYYATGRIKGAAPRLLPWLVAANPVNYGELCLSSP